jgi:hypothetical protein
MVDLYTTVQQHEFEVTIADREHQIPSHRPQDHPGSELPPFNRLRKKALLARLR